jgi:hypothetical protein
MHRVVIGLILVLSLSFSVQAEVKRELVMEMLEVTEAKKNHDFMVQSYINHFTKNPKLNTEEFKTYFNEAISWDSLIEPMILIYIESYTEKELQAIIDFFGSEVGQSFIKKSPEVMEKSTAIMMASIEKAMSHLQKK